MKGADVLKEIQLKNFRSLKDTKLQKLSPITVLVGENSSGKSSFLRMFPLLKQSISKRTSGPVLWSGDVDDYVDFGSFEETVTNDGSNSIVFRFNFLLSGRSRFYYHFDKQIENVDVGFEITITSISGKDNVSKFTLSLNSDVFYFDIVNNIIRINDNFEFKTPEIMIDEEDSSRNSFLRASFLNVKCRSFGFSLPKIKSIWEEIINAAYINPPEDKEEIEIYPIASAAFCLGKQLINVLSKKSAYRKESTNTETDEDKDFANIFERLKQGSKNNSNLQSYAKLIYAYFLFSDIDDYIMFYFKNVHYIAPLRATAERYYRLRNLAVDEVDYQGKNLAIFINSLSNRQIKEFNAWTLEYFGFSVNTELSKGHLSLQIKLKNSKKAINLSDTGFGYSQVLPIITELWELSSKSTKEIDYYYRQENQLIPLVVAIEQPELHLHPAVQAKLAKAFIACIKLAKDHGYQLQLIIETHSETIINYFGRAIYRKQLDPNDVSVILFEKQENSGITKVENSYYDEEGYLKNWPYGFFGSEE